MRRNIYQVEMILAGKQVYGFGIAADVHGALSGAEAAFPEAKIRGVEFVNALNFIHNPKVEDSGFDDEVINMSGA